mmetsp:Transcript_20664/g.45943  ORF Transcript_20664/g.45943 Transcript_20664/m.45943 type:complete len:87 (-) Transcript_20664:66-326(-)
MINPLVSWHCAVPEQLVRSEQSYSALSKEVGFCFHETPSLWARLAATLQTASPQPDGATACGLLQMTGVFGRDGHRAAPPMIIAIP